MQKDKPKDQKGSKQSKLPKGAIPRPGSGYMMPVEVASSKGRGEIIVTPVHKDKEDIDLRELANTLIDLAKEVKADPELRKKLQREPSMK